MADLKIVYTCEKIRFEGKAAHWEATCLETEDVGKINVHREKVLRERPDEARNHMLDINKYEDGKWKELKGMCLPDAVIDVEGKSVKHFIDTWSRGPEKK